MKNVEVYGFSIYLNKLYLHQTSQTFIIKIFIAPPKIGPFDFGDGPLNYGEPTSAVCTILGGDLPMNITWLLNGYPIDLDIGITVGSMGKRTHILNIDSVSQNHAGNYTCSALNKAGIAQHTAELIVNGLFNLALRRSVDGKFYFCRTSYLILSYPIMQLSQTNIFM